MFNPKTLQSSLKPLFYVTKLLGLSPFRIKEDRYKSSWLYIIWSLSLMVSFGCYSFYAVNYKPVDAAIITKITDRLNIYLCILSVCIGMLFGCVNRKDIVAVINDISEIDKKLKQLKLDIELDKTYRKTVLYLIASMILVSISLFVIVLLDMLAFADTIDCIRIGELIAYNSPVATIFIEFQFCTLALLLKERFSWLNEEMLEIEYSFGKNHILDSLTTNNYKCGLQDKALIIIEQISIKHYELCNISRRLNNAYSCQILLIIMQSFMTIVAMSFYVAKNIFSNETFGVHMDYRLYFGPALILYFTSMVILTNVCSSTTRQAHKTAVLLHRIVSLCLCINNEGYVDLGVVCFSLQLLHQNVNFTACKLFVIDETLLATIVGAAATYLVIVLQFEIGVTTTKTQYNELNYTVTSH